MCMCNRLNVLTCWSVVICKDMPWANPEGGGAGSPPPPSPEKSQKYRVSYQYWSGSPEQSQSYQASIQCWAIISPPAKRHLNGISLVGRWWPINSVFGSCITSTKKKKEKKKRYQIWIPSDKTFWLRACMHVSTCRSVNAGKLAKYITQKVRAQTKVYKWFKSK